MKDKIFLDGLEAVGIDTMAGMKYLSDNVSEYRYLLAAFVKESEKKLPLVRELAESGAFEEYTILVHGLKSNAKTLGINRLANLALWHESKSRAGNYSEVLKELPVLIEAWEESIRAVLSVEDEELKQLMSGKYLSEGNKEPDREHIAMLIEKAVMKIDAFEQEEAVNTLIQLLEYSLDKKTESSIKTAISLLNDFNYDEALQVLS